MSRNVFRDICLLTVLLALLTCCGKEGDGVSVDTVAVVNGTLLKAEDLDWMRAHMLFSGRRAGACEALKALVDAELLRQRYLLSGGKRANMSRFEAIRRFGNSALRILKPSTNVLEGREVPQESQEDVEGSVVDLSTLREDADMVVLLNCQ
jgi:hypothetical protein